MSVRSGGMQTIVVADGPVYEGHGMGGLDGLAVAEVLARAERGDRAAWEILVERHDRRVVVSLLARGMSIDRAKDLAQETWARLWEQQQAGKLGRIDLPGLAIRQATFLGIDEARRRARRGVGAALTDDLVDPEVGAEARLASRQQIDRALAELERMSPRAREIFCAVYDRPGVPHSETARHMGLSVQRLRQTLCEVRTRLRAAMEVGDE